MKTFEILQELPKCNIESPSEKMLLEKMVPTDLLVEGCLKSSICNNKKKAVKLSSIRQGMPVNLFFFI